MKRILQFSQVLALALISISAVGCGSNNGPPTGEVHGQVTYNNEPVEGCSVVFTPKAGGRSSSAMTDAEGNYELKYTISTMGALVGQHRVELFTAVQRVVNDEGVVKNEGRKEMLPKEYNSATTQVAEVAAGDNTIDFHITGK
ncbi:hypothetical protein [Bremerella cremea]|uniref:hypothetical protein n=1 Tax=Bremerella cremea TaxID=1031537 RepID=UPI0031EFF76A